MVRHLVLTWWECIAACPNLIEDLLIGLDTAIEKWDEIRLIGSIETGFRMETK